MLGKTVLLYTHDRVASRRLSGHLRAAGTEMLMVDTAPAAIQLVAAAAVDLVLLDGAVDFQAAFEVMTVARGRIPAVVLSVRGEPMLDFVCQLEVEHFLARAGDADASLDDLAREVVVTTEKILRNDLFGIDKYLPSFGTELTSAVVRNASDRDGIVACIGEHVAWLGAGRAARGAVATIVDELVTNAVYDAPRDDAGRPRYAACDRRDKIVLDPWEFVTVRWGSDGESLAISVTDWFGALRPEHVRSGLRRCLLAGDPIEQKAGGAGLGLHTALAYSTQLVINVDRGLRTEIIAIVDLRRRGQGARPGGRSLHLFFDDSRARGVEARDATPTTIVVSDSMRSDLWAQLVPGERRVDPTAAIAPPPPPPPAVPPARVRARGSSAPLAGESIGAGTACGLLHGAADAITAIQIAVRFLSLHYQAVVAYELQDERLEARLAGGRVQDWSRLRELRLARDGTASVAALAAVGDIAAFHASCPMDYRVAMLASGDADVPGVVVPLCVADELRWVLYGASPRPDAPVTAAMLQEVRQETEDCLDRLDPNEIEIEIVQLG